MLDLFYEYFTKSNFIGTPVHDQCEKYSKSNESQLTKQTNQVLCQQHDSNRLTPFGPTSVTAKQLYNAYQRLVAYSKGPIHSFLYYKLNTKATFPSLSLLAVLMMMEEEYSLDELRFNLYNTMSVALCNNLLFDLHYEWTKSQVFLLPIDSMEYEPEPDYDISDDIFGIDCVFKKILYSGNRVEFESAEHGGWKFNFYVDKFRIYNAYQSGNNTHLIHALHDPSNINRLHMIILGLWQNEDQHVTDDDCRRLDNMFVLDFFYED